MMSIVVSHRKAKSTHSIPAIGFGKFVTTIISLLFLFVSPAFARSTIVVNKWNNELKYYETNQPTRQFRVATGLYKCTPQGTFKIIQKTYISKSGKGPYGTRWMGLNTLGVRGLYHIGIHGTNTPSSIGKYSSNACVRMFNDDVNWLFERAKIGTTVRIVDIPIRKKTELTFKKWVSLIHYTPSVKLKIRYGTPWTELKHPSRNFSQIFNLKT